MAGAGVATLAPAFVSTVPGPASHIFFRNKLIAALTPGEKPPISYLRIISRYIEREGIIWQIICQAPPGLAHIEVPPQENGKGTIADGNG